MRKIVFSALVPLLILAGANGVCLADVNDDLFDAAQRGNVEKVKLLLAKGADINYKDKIVLGHTPMTIAAAFDPARGAELWAAHRLFRHRRGGRGAHRQHDRTHRRAIQRIAGG